MCSCCPTGVTGAKAAKPVPVPLALNRAERRKQRRALRRKGR